LTPFFKSFPVFWDWNMAFVDIGTLAISFIDDSLAVGDTAVVGLHGFEEIKETVHWDLGFGRWKKNPEESMFGGG
jgi:hypothetical protein